MASIRLFPAVHGMPINPALTFRGVTSTPLTVMLKPLSHGIEKNTISSCGSVISAVNPPDVPLNDVQVVSRRSCASVAMCGSASGMV